MLLSLYKEKHSIKNRLMFEKTKCMGNKDLYDTVLCLSFRTHSDLVWKEKKTVIKSLGNLPRVRPRSHIQMAALMEWMRRKSLVVDGDL